MPRGTERGEINRKSRKAREIKSGEREKLDKRLNKM